jgi:hypothetical protein
MFNKKEFLRNYMLKMHVSFVDVSAHQFPMHYYVGSPINSSNLVVFGIKEYHDGKFDGFRFDGMFLSEVNDYTGFLYNM